MKRTYTKEELQALHRELYDILRETIRVCEEHDIRYFLIGGTAIGALYDQAILPWDDDIDIGMTGSYRCLPNLLASNIYYLITKQTPKLLTTLQK